MFTLVRMVSFRSLLVRQAPTLVASLIVAEIFYKFGSFTLECLAYLATWFVLDGVAALIERQLNPLPPDGAKGQP